MPFMSKVLVCDRLFSRKVLDFFRFVSNNHNSHRIFLSNMCPFLVAVGNLLRLTLQSQEPVSIGGELRLNRTNTPKTSSFVKFPERNGPMFLPVPLQDGEAFGDYQIFPKKYIGTTVATTVQSSGS